jgi:hypothetical protein
MHKAAALFRITRIRKTFPQQLIFFVEPSYHADWGWVSFKDAVTGIHARQNDEAEVCGIFPRKVELMQAKNCRSLHFGRDDKVCARYLAKSARTLKSIFGK